MKRDPLPQGPHKTLFTTRSCSLFLLSAPLLFGLGVEASAQNPNRAWLVVVVYPQNSDGSPGNFQIDQGIRKTFAAQSAHPIEIYNEYLDVSQSKDASLQKLQRDYLTRKYAGRRVDLVIAGLSPALDFVIRNREVFPKAPVVFCAVDEGEVQCRELPPDVIGHPCRFELEETLKLALKLHPNLEHVAVVAGKAAMDLQWEANAKEIFEPYKGRLDFAYLTGLKMEDLEDEVATLPPRSIIYYLHVFQDGTGRTPIPSHVLDRLAEHANAPIYSHVNTYVGRGIVGGRVFQFSTEGEIAAALGLRILAGEKPKDIGIQAASRSVAVFDARQLNRWNIDPSLLPPESIVQFQEPNYWERYQWQILGVSALLILQGALIFGLLFQRVHWKNAENRFRLAVESAPYGMVMVNTDGKIVLANPQLEKLFGYAPAEVVGRPVEILVPEMFRESHSQDRKAFFQAPEIRLMGVGREITGRRKDGTVFAVEIGLSPLKTKKGLCVLASVVDITERQQAIENLRTSKRQLRQLTNRLIEAQEQERRRIARELHDDFNQNLALLSVKLDLLRQSVPKLNGDVGVKFDEISAQVRDLSSALHQLSHELHPLKLEQLGLETSIRSLCRELSGHHPLNIEFVARQVPRSIPSEIALCLYRIVQESLRNILKHSGSREAHIDLVANNGEIRLEIADSGSGFDMRLLETQGGLGFISMRERLGLVGGEIEIESNPCQGTKIHVRVPFPSSEMRTKTFA